MSLVSTLRFLIGHPLSRRNPLGAVGRFASWQMRCRLRDELVEPWIGGARLAARRGMEGATGNLYCGLHEFPEMAFVLHLLRPGELFIDVGANIGSYTVLAAKVCGAQAISAEPDPDALAALARNVAVNGIEGRVRIEACALGAETGQVNFSTGLKSGNRVVAVTGPGVRQVPLRRLDDIVGAGAPALIKMDVEGFEEQVMAGALNTLAQPSLMAVLSEWGGEGLIDTLAGFGFERRYYDPFARTLSPEPVEGLFSDPLFDRPGAALETRLAAAEQRTIHGVTF